MAKKQNTSSSDVNSFSKGLIEDMSGYGKGPQNWSHARNAVNNTEIGDLGTLSNEKSNKLCTLAPYTIIGTIHIEGDKFVVFSTNNIFSEIGLFDESECSYTKLVNATCLNFKTDYLITGQAKENFECKFEVYWSDGFNPDRVLNIDDIPWVENCEYIDSCYICTPTAELDCEKLRLEPLVDNLKFSIAPGATSGELLSGSYFVVGAYLINGQRFGDYSMPSQVQGIWSHANTASSLDVTVDFADQRFDEFELIVLSFVNYQQVAKRAGVYSTRQKLITIDQFQSNWPDVNPGDILLRNPVEDKSDSIWRNGDYLLRIGPTSKFDFNYQPIANQIKTEWVSVEYPENYYGNGGNNTGYMRDEVYSFFIRWVYNTGDKSPSFHIPGRFSNQDDLTIMGGPDAAVDADDGITPYKWRVYNTAIINPTITPYTLPDGGVVLGGGDMAYWESSEIYDDDKPQIWNATYTDPVTGVNIGGTSDTRFDLCGKPIRHHKFPANNSDPEGHPITHHVNDNGSAIRVMGVKFSNIKKPLDNYGNEITNVVGYEILRGSREGNKSIFFKGMLCNLREYDVPEGTTDRQGLYQNYPYNDLGADNYLQSNFPLVGSSEQCKHENLTGYRQDAFSFHSPDTNFKDPYLSAKEVIIYGEQYGEGNMNFEIPDKHPKHKLITDQALIIACIVGIAYPITAALGKRSYNRKSPTSENRGGTWFGMAAGFQPLDVAGGHGLGIAALSGIHTGRVLGQYAAVNDFSILGASFAAGVKHPQVLYDTTGGWALDNFATAAPGVSAQGYTETVEGSDYSALGPVLGSVVGIASWIFNYMKGIDMFLDIIRAVSTEQQYALQCVSHCFQRFYERPQPNNIRRAIGEQGYIGPALVDWTQDFRINNIFRSRFVAIQTEALNPNDALIADPVIVDNSNLTLGEASKLKNGPTREDIHGSFNFTASSYYVALKQRIRNQYGQINGIVQVPVSTGTTLKNYGQTIANGPSSTDIMFNGDIYIGRYTEKNSMIFFYDWLYDQPDGYEYNYFLRQNAAYVSYWMNSEKYDIGELLQSIDTTDMFAFIDDPQSATVALPFSKYCMDTFDGYSLEFGRVLLENHFFYLFNSGVKDFYVETEINIDYRDWEDEINRRHYDSKRYTHLPTLFNANPNIIKAGNYYKYDWSLSVSRLFNNFLAWGNTQSREYDPQVAETCYTYRPDRIIYSLPQRAANKQDFWRIFLPFNYKDFTSRPRAVKQFSKNGALILFDNMSPITFAGVDQLTTDQDTKLTIGDGGLFSQPMQNLANSEWPIEYGSCQDKYSAINTPAGFYYVSQNQGKVFTLTSGTIQEISNRGLKWWFSEFLPYKLTEDFPDFKLKDNPVAGIGCQTIYDNLNQIVYFSKKDYQLKKDLPEGTTLRYSGDSDLFYLNNTMVPITLGNPLYFDSASWTISYDPKTQSWISYHDWHPDLTISSKNTFLSTKANGIWIHNNRCDSYCNFYDVDYPFEVEFGNHTGGVVNTLRNVEYYMEAYKYAENCYDRFHDLDFNFDEAIIHNSEQVSGLLRLNLQPKNNTPEMLKYPKVNYSNIDIVYSKEEQKYRFNQFWDITADRGEFNSTATRTIFNTEPNGYIRNLNFNNLNYNKNAFQRKKFRHFKNSVFLRRKKSGDRNIIISTAVNMNLKSSR
jgi:hypothetical protein